MYVQLLNVQIIKIIVQHVLLIDKHVQLVMEAISLKLMELVHNVHPIVLLVLVQQCVLLVPPHII